MVGCYVVMETERILWALGSIFPAGPLGAQSVQTKWRKEKEMPPNTVTLSTSLPQDPEASELRHPATRSLGSFCPRGCCLQGARKSVREKGKKADDPRKAG